jgi:hypothetical protein
LTCGGGIRFTHAAVLAAGESVMAARERHGHRPEPFGHGNARAAGQHRGRLRSDAEDDAGRCRAERSEVVLVTGGREHVQPEERVVPGTVVLGRQPETGGVGPGLGTGIVAPDGSWYGLVCRQFQQ